MNPFSTPWKHQMVEKGCTGNEWVKIFAKILEKNHNKIKDFNEAGLRKTDPVSLLDWKDKKVRQVTARHF